MKKTLCILLIFIYVFSSWSTFAYKAEPIKETPVEVFSDMPTNGIKGNDGIYIEDNRYISLNQETSTLSFEEYMLSCAQQQQEIIDISAYGIRTEDFENIFFKFVFDYPESFITNAGYTVTSSLTRVQTVKPRYIVDKSKKEEFKAILENKLKEYEDLVKDEPDQLKKYLLIHSKMIRECHYDYTYSDTAYTAYGFFANGAAVCQGYASALKIICDRVGIEVRYSLCDQSSHMWNYIKINDVWYQTDVTWDDYSAKLSDDSHLSTNDQGALHSYFLCSDSSFVLSGHGSTGNYNTLTDEKPVCNNTQYEGDEWIFNLKGSSGGSYLTDITFENNNLLLNFLGFTDSNGDAVKFVVNNLSEKDMYTTIPCISSTGAEYMFFSKNGYPKTQVRFVASNEDGICHIETTPIVANEKGGFYRLSKFTIDSDKLEKADNLKLHMWSNMIPLTGVNSFDK